MVEDLDPGKFYWVWLVLDRDAESWENAPMVARYAGASLWNLPGKDGLSNWPMRWIGPEVEKP